MDYSGGTVSMPSIYLAYHVLNCLTNMVSAGTFTSNYTYDAVGELLSDDGPWPDDTVSYTYQNRLRQTMSLSQPGGLPWEQTYSYDLARRLTNIVSPAGSFGYTNQSIAAKYLYDPYGNTLSASGPLAQANVYRFSSKAWDANAGLYYYLYRFYDPNLQRWSNRDPLQEVGGINLYEFVADNPISFFDSLGQNKYDGKITFDGLGWEVTSTMGLDLATEDGPDEDFQHGLKVVWEAKVKVVCLCCSPHKVKKGTRVKTYTWKNDIWFYVGGKSFFDIPLPKDIWDGLGELIAKGFESNLRHRTFHWGDPRIEAQVRENVKIQTPRKPSDGHWKGGKSPCG